MSGPSKLMQVVGMRHRTIGDKVALRTMLECAIAIEPKTALRDTFLGNETDEVWHSIADEVDREYLERHPTEWIHVWEPLTDEDHAWLNAARDRGLSARNLDGALGIR